jgi:hypothetical protein
MSLLIRLQQQACTPLFVHFNNVACLQCYRDYIAVLHPNGALSGMNDSNKIQTLALMLQLYTECASHYHCYRVDCYNLLEMSFQLVYCEMLRVALGPLIGNVGLSNHLVS